jgi:Rieske 2Fe-2S family protein
MKELTMKSHLAPLPAASLQECLRPFGESRMLPRDAYVDDKVLAWERRELFDGGWRCIGRCDAVKTPGSQMAVKVGQSGVLLARDLEGQLRAFENICRHRGHELLACGTSTQRNNVMCPYHAWTYGLDGGLRNARGITEIRNAKKEELSLIPISLTEWGGWVFVNLSGQAQPFADYLGDLDQRTAAWEFERLVVGASHDYELQANWKVAIENYHECYHCRMIHPALCVASPAESGSDFENRTGAYTGGWMELAENFQTMSFDGHSKGLPFRRLDAEQRRQVHYITLFPGLLISLHPDYVMTHRLDPVAPDLTRVECQWLFSPEAVARKDFSPDYAVDFWDKTNREDWAAVESVQRGLESERFVPGILSEDESSVYDFVNLVAKAYLGQSERLAQRSPTSPA